MATIVIETGDGKAATLEAEGAERILDLCDEAALPHLFSCRASNCGVCVVDVLDGASLLDPPGAGERATLHRLGANEAQRLGCQLRVVPASGIVMLRLADRGGLSLNRA